MSWSTPPVVVVQDGGEQWRFTGLSRVVAATHPADVPPVLAAVERAVTEDGLHAAGYLAYEAAAAYGLSTHQPVPDGPPLAWFGLFSGRERVSLPAGGNHRAGGGHSFGPWEPSISRDNYEAAVDAVRAAIADGITYQANLTFNLRAAFEGDPWALYGALCRAQRAGYTAYLDLGDHVIVSASPELFFRREGAHIVARPMKGTAPRGLTTAADQAQAAWLQASQKNRAENVMIVDMIRNDLGRVASTGSVAVPELFAVERYPTLWQMTSTVSAETDANLPDLMAAVFPCASITGAPKVRTMQLLRTLETEPRGVYTGTIGLLTPDGRSQFNVAIRTVVLDRRTGIATYGVGSGIVWDSEPAAEYAECLLKARVLAAESVLPPDFALLESLRWTPDEGYRLLARHMDRLAASAEYFDIPLRRGEVMAALETAAHGLPAPAKVRLLLMPDGRHRIETLPLMERSVPVRLGLAAEPVSSADRWLYHKTTVRGVYDRARAGRPDCDDVILFNERYELTETSTANLIVELDGERTTPPVDCGLLAGTAREEWLARGELVERVMMVDELTRATGLWVLNSVRGLESAVLV